MFSVISYIIMLMVILALLVAKVNAETRIIGIIIPGLHQSDFKGVYDKIIAKAIVEMPETKLENYPPVRADAVFANCNNCCISPSNKNPDFYDYGDEVVTTEPFNVAKIYIFTAPGRDPISNLDALRGKVVGMRYGMPYGKRFDRAPIVKFPVSELREHIKLMSLGHLDAFVAYVPDVYQMFQEEGVEPFPHDAEKPFAVHHDGLSCKGVANRYIENFNARLSVMREDGTLATLLSGRYIIGQ